MSRKDVKAQPLTLKSATQQILDRAASFMEDTRGAIFMPEKVAKKDAAIWAEARRVATNYIRLGAKG